MTNRIPLTILSKLDDPGSSIEISLDSLDFRTKHLNQNIMSIIRSIDMSSDREKELEKYKNDPEFSQFLDDMLLQIGAGTINEYGQFEFKEL